MAFNKNLRFQIMIFLAGLAVVLAEEEAAESDLLDLVESLLEFVYLLKMIGETIQYMQQVGFCTTLLYSALLTFAIIVVYKLFGEVIDAIVHELKNKKYQPLRIGGLMTVIANDFGWN